METVFAHGDYSMRGANRFLVGLRRAEWLDSWEMFVDVRDAVIESRAPDGIKPDMDSGISFAGYAYAFEDGAHLAAVVELNSMEDPTGHLNERCQAMYGESARVLTNEEVTYGLVGNLPDTHSITRFAPGHAAIALANWDNENKGEFTSNLPLLVIYGSF